MSSHKARVHAAVTPTSAESRCFRGQRSILARFAATLGYALLAAVAMLGLTSSAASTQAAEASLLVTDFAAARGVEAAR